MIISLIVAVDRNLGIGYEGDLLWRLPKDMAFFKKTTIGNPIITGRKNYFSIPAKFRPLKDRKNIVLTRSKEKIEEDIIQCNSIEKSIEIASKTENCKEVFIIGGGEIYKQFLDLGLVDSMYITHVDAELKADTNFPKLNMEKWETISEEHHKKDSKNKFDFAIKKYKKIKIKPSL